jgi:hypothetical protein
MTVRHLRLMIGLFFLVAGTAILALRFCAPEVAARVNDPMRLLIGGLLGLVLAGVNLAKWYAGWLAAEERATPVRHPFQPDPTASADPENNPDFDFTRSDEPTKK